MVLQIKMNTFRLELGLVYLTPSAAAGLRKKKLIGTVT